jgi:L-histidine Nalpha-methyltransferase
MTPPVRSALRKELSWGAGSDYSDALLAGLRSEPKAIPCKYFYDQEGSRLFEKISTLPEYYLTRTELMLLSRHAGEIAGWIGPEAEIVEFGAGASTKIRVLLNALTRPRSYMPVDISATYVKTMAAGVQADYPELIVRPLIADFSLGLPSGVFSHEARRVGFFPGSTIGNLAPAEATEFLVQAGRILAGGGLLIGVDLVKDPSLLHAAYNDRDGVTAAFNKNLLMRANREGLANFQLQNFAHYAPYNVLHQRVEMYLVSTVPQRVTILNRVVSIGEGEAIHTEWSYKYTVDGFRALARDAGFIPRAVWCDEKRLFSLHWLEAPRSL